MMARSDRRTGTVDSDVAQRGEGRDARRLDGGADAGDEGRADADHHAGDDGTGGDHEVGIGQLQTRLHHRLQDGGDADAGNEADCRRQHADDQCLGGNSQYDLAARRSDRPHQRRLTSALGDQDRERVMDAEGGDDDGDAGERQQQRLEEAEEVALDVALLLGRELGAGERFDPTRQCGGDSGFELLGGDAVHGAHEHAGDRVGTSGEKLLRRVGVEGDVGHAADPFGLAVGRQTDDGHGDAARE